MKDSMDAQLIFGFSYMASHISAMFATINDVPSFAMLIPPAHFPEMFSQALASSWFFIRGEKRTETTIHGSAQNTRTFQRRNVVIARGRKSCMTRKWKGSGRAFRFLFKSHFLGLRRKLFNFSLHDLPCQMHQSVSAKRQAKSQELETLLSWWSCLSFLFLKFAMKAQWLCVTCPFICFPCRQMTRQKQSRPIEDQNKSRFVQRSWRIVTL